jgi:hypothetical protein
MSFYCGECLNKSDLNYRSVGSVIDVPDSADSVFFRVSANSAKTPNNSTLHNV